MKDTNEIIRTLIPLEKLMSPWDDERFILRAPTYEEILKLPAEERYYQENWGDFVVNFPDQGNRGTCVAWCNALDEEINRFWEDEQPDNLSEEDLYWKARKYDGIPDFLGEGSNNLGAMKARHKEGVCKESTYPTSKDKNAPSPGIQINHSDYLTEAAQHVIDAYYQVPLMPSSWKSALAGQITQPQWEGPKPLVVAYKVTREMLDYAQANQGFMPDNPGVDMLGGHSSLFVGYFWHEPDGQLYFINWNSWGQDAGDYGFFYFPASYLFNGIILEAWVSHYGEPITPPPQDSECPIGLILTSLYNIGNMMRGGKTRLKAVVP